MAFETEFKEFMPDTVTIEPYVGKDSRGTRQYGTAKTYQCRIVGAGLSLRRATNEDNTVIYDVYTTGVPVGETAVAVFTVDDRITLPSATVWEREVPQIFAIKRYTDDGGFHHIKIQCGFMYHRQGQ